MLGHQREECQPYSSPALSRTLTRSRGDSEGGDNYISVGIGTGTGATNSSTTADPAPSSTTPTKTSSSSGSSSSSHYLSTPQLVEALLPERGGALVRQVRASSDRTCAVTACGDMYTWGDTISQGVLGLGGGSSYSPVPRKVRGIKRSVRLTSLRIGIGVLEMKYICIFYISIPSLLISDFPPLLTPLHCCYIPYIY